MDRRRFLQTVAGAAGLALGGADRLFAQPRQAADLIFLNGLIVTMNSAQPLAEAVAVKNGRVAAVGAQAQIEALRDNRTRVVNLAGRSLTPGLIDAHSHLLAFGQMELYMTSIRPPRVHSFDTLNEVLAEAAAKTPRGQWILARGFNEFDEGRFPLRQELDPATPNHPVLAIHWTGQYGLANTCALQTKNLLREDVADPYGGKYLRDRRTGLPNGWLLHYPAIYAVHQPSYSDTEEAEALKFGANKFVAQGITCVHDNFCTGTAGLQYIRADRQGTLPLRVRLYPYVSNLQVCQTVIARAPRYSGPLVRLQGLKLAVDGYPLMYRVLPQHEQFSMPMHPPDQFQAIVSAIHNAGLQVDVHAAGDRGVDMTLDAFSRAAGGDRQVCEHRHRLEHAMMYKRDTLAREADMGVPVCTQPAWIPMRAADLTRRLGADQVDRMVPVQSMRQAGVPVCFGADVPASPTYLPLDSIACAMDRRVTRDLALNEEEKVSFAEALEAHTLSAAYAAGDEREMGSVEVGKVADFAVWDADLRQVNETNVRDLQVVATFVGGQCVWEA